MQLTIRGVTLNLGGEIEARAAGVAEAAIINSGREWLRFAQHVLGAQHEVVQAMQRMIDNYDAREARGGR
jgi:hypothetical protein